MPTSPFLDEALPAQAPADARWVWAVVTQSSPLRIRLDGDRVPLAITPDDMGADPRPIGQRVYCQMLNRRLTIFGPDVRTVPVMGLLPASADLNLYITEGSWALTDAVRNTITNQPVPPWPAIGHPNVGVIRPGGVGTFFVIPIAGTRVLQRFEGISSLTQGPVPLTWERLRGSTGVWGPWRLTDTGIPVLNAADQDLLAKVYTAPSVASPTRTTLSSVRPPMEMVTNDGTSWYNSGDRTFQNAPGWVPITYANANWTDYAAGYGGVQVNRTAEGIVIIRGLAKYIPAGNPGGQVIGNIPAGYRPAHRTPFGTIDTTNTSGGNFVIEPNGNITWLGNTSGTAPFVPLEGMYPSAEVAPDSAWTQITTFSNSGTPSGGGVNWTDYNSTDSSWPLMGYWVDRLGRVWFRGMCKPSGAPSGESIVFHIPAIYKPNKQLHFSGPGNSGMSAWHVVYDSGNNRTAFVWKTNSGIAWNGLSNFVLLPEASFPEAGWLSVALQMGWIPYDVTTFPGAGAWMCSDGLIFFRGLIKNGTGTPITNNAPSYRTPAAGGGSFIQVTLAAYPSNNVARVDLQPGGNISPVPAPGATLWRSLNGIQYLVEG